MNLNGLGALRDGSGSDVRSRTVDLVAILTFGDDVTRLHR